MRLVFKNLNILRSIINAISTSVEMKEIVESAGNNLPNLFDFSSFGVFWKEDLLFFLYEEESCPPAFTQEVVNNMLKVFSTLGGESVDADRVVLQTEKRKLRPRQMTMDSTAALKSYLTLPLALEGEILGCISLNSDQPNAFDAQDLQFFSVIGYQMAATLRHFQRFSSVKNMAIYDTLTGLHNRRYFEERLEVEAQKSLHSNTPLSLVMVDIDFFKKVNDTFGHTEGDQVLCKVSSLLKTSVRKKDIVARYGGEEFILILPEARLDETFVMAERIRRLVEETLFEVGKAQVNLTLSLGISNFPSHRVKSKEELMEMADQALYDAKRGGRNRVCIFTGKSTRKTVPA
ncbi:MAG TPA: sensor domain-containing diguanylate cyclase [Thermodesulfobacteriota bacterium]|nr:sensor domain-containing diguanylate cyclase [Thermodesulfobacteriota bacterium]